MAARKNAFRLWLATGSILSVTTLWDSHVPTIEVTYNPKNQKRMTRFIHELAYRRRADIEQAVMAGVVFVTVAGSADL